ncbi:MAG: integrin alpha [Gammaproteobacteria bacterium]|nr:integrin alpha [Gammaproteobacteria bacterium]
MNMNSNHRKHADAEQNLLGLAVTALLLGAVINNDIRAQPFPATIELDQLTGSNGFRIDGVSTFDRSGRAVAGAGDINGDGIDDLLIGAYYADPNDLSNAGSSFVVFGRNTAAVGEFSRSLALSSLNGSNGFRLDGPAPDYHSGITLAGAGDINGDGTADLIIGAPLGDPNGKRYAGISYVVFGRDTTFPPFPANFPLNNLTGNNGFRLTGVSDYDHSGISVAAAGDINGDGIDDLIIGAYGASYNRGSSYVMFGRHPSSTTSFPATVGLGSFNGSNGFRIDGESPGDQSGRSVSAAGDINGDGIDDLIVGAPLDDPNNINNAGSSYVIFGRNTTGGNAFPPNLAVSILDGIIGFRLDGTSEGDDSGRSVAAAGDVNGDGIDDFIVGAGEANTNSNVYAGAIYVVFGRNTDNAETFPAILALEDLDGNNGFRVDGEAANDFFGRSVSTAGDVNGDGLADLIVDAAGHDPNDKNDAGSSYVIFGRKTGKGDLFPPILTLDTLNGRNGFRLNGVNEGDQSGVSVAAAGDINGDGLDDMIVGASIASPIGTIWGGSSYVIFGRSDIVFVDDFEQQSLANPDFLD